MSETRTDPPLPPGLFQVLTLGPNHPDTWRADIRAKGGGHAIAWTNCTNPDQNFAEFVPAAAKAHAVILRFNPGANQEQAVQRWAWLSAQLGVSHCIVVVENKDLPPEGRKGFDRVIHPVVSFIKGRCTFDSLTCIPISSQSNGNIAERDTQVGWYMGPTLREHLDTLQKNTPVPERTTTCAGTLEADHFQAQVYWVDSTPLIPWRPYRLEGQSGVLEASVTDIKYERDAHSEDRIARNRLQTGDIGVCNISTAKPLVASPFRERRDEGLLRLLDPDKDELVALVVVDYALRRATNVRWQETTITPSERAAQKKQNACVLWFTGLSGAGKSTIADLIEKRLNAAGKHTMLLDGDNVRHGLNKDLGFTDVDRVENIRRIAEVSKLMCDAGLIVLVSFISPFRAERALARETVADHGFHEIYIATSLQDAEARDVKGLYAKARRGEIKNFTGIDSPYEPPETPEITVDTTKQTAEQAAQSIVSEVFGL